jgi:hypothetical protein
MSIAQICTSCQYELREKLMKHLFMQLLYQTHGTDDMDIVIFGLLQHLHCIHIRLTGVRLHCLGIGTTGAHPSEGFGGCGNAEDAWKRIVPRLSNLIHGQAPQISRLACSVWPTWTACPVCRVWPVLTYMLQEGGMYGLGPTVINFHMNRQFSIHNLSVH